LFDFNKFGTAFDHISTLHAFRVKGQGHIAT